MRALTSAILLSLTCAALPTAASVFKCAAEKGEVVYQDVPCGAGRELRNFDTDPPALTVIPSGCLSNLACPTQWNRGSPFSPIERRYLVNWMTT